jgi:hypothetical protein
MLLAALTAASAESALNGQPVRLTMSMASDDAGQPCLKKTLVPLAFHA